ncbi:hypothetical protein [uncultured Phenylobacterium sp.]|uniref:hypothetical protein n=1 Tax=uncultured Phenylobacterium sp. TaxID=349273 RepID=UPI0025CF5429|nr:hypothetical protein [uncultured Phenylobacterium sp.]
MATSEVFDRAADLWPQLVERAGLTGAGPGRRAAYDQDLVTELRERLFPGEMGDLESLLEASDLTAEDLIRAFLATLKPFAEMKVDILSMLAAAGAHASGDSLPLRFNFDPDNEPLDLLLTEFRGQMERFEQVMSPTLVLVSHDDLWAIPQAGDADRRTWGVDPDGVTAGLTAWLNTYDAGGRFESWPEDWATGREDVDRRLGRAVALANTFIAAFRRHGIDHELLRAAGASEAGEQRDVTGFTIRELWIIESDFWHRSLAHWLMARRGDVRRGDEVALVAMMAEIDRILPESAAPARELRKVLDDILDLPVWQHRHEVYAVWLGAQIFTALSDAGWRFQFHLQDGRLEFAFRGVHLATLSDRMGLSLFWWTELRTEHDDLPSAHRTEGIQPDYRVRRPPISDPGSDLLVVEAKQHLRSSTQEFLDALTDYAFACPNAAVYLANHGPVSANVLQRLDPVYLARCAAFGSLHPGFPESVIQFRRGLAASLGSALDGAASAMSPGRVEVRLTWGDKPSDLDLYVTPVGAEDEGVSFRRGEAPGLRYEGDVTTGWGPEVVHIDGVGIYDVTVHRYSTDGELETSGAMVTVIFRGHGPERRNEQQVPTPFFGHWWRAARIDTRGRTIEALDGD